MLSVVRSDLGIGICVLYGNSRIWKIKRMTRDKFPQDVAQFSGSKMKSMIIGISGGTGAGKTMIAESIADSLGRNDVLILDQDSYYIGRNPWSVDNPDNLNFDHPDAIDFQLLIENLCQLRMGNVIEKPLYDFFTHVRKKETVSLHPRKWIILEGLLIFCNKKVRDLLDLKFFVEAPADIRLARRIKRDISGRGRAIDSVLNQYIQTVRPMYEEFIEPSKKWADMIIDWSNNDYSVIRPCMKMILSKYESTGKCK